MKDALREIDLKHDVWNWEVYTMEKVFGLLTPPSLAGESTYEVSLVALTLLGVRIVDESPIGLKRYFLNGHRVFVRYLRVDDGARVTMWGPDDRYQF